MNKKVDTTYIVDSLLRFAVGGGLLVTILVAPNAVQALDKPLKKYYRGLDKRSREREYRKTLSYMKSSGLIKGDYEHGLIVTEKGRKRAEKASFEQLQIQQPRTWDKKWRLVIYDIPEEHKGGRNSLVGKLKDLGFYQLQKSTWVHPYPCKNEVETVAVVYEIEKFVTYIETTYIDHQEILKKHFPGLK